MEKNIISEINRINSLMGGKSIISEAPNPKLLAAFIDDLAKTSPKVLYNFNKLVRSARNEGRQMTDSEIDIFVNDCKKAGAFTDDEAKAFAKILKEDKDIRNALNSTDDFFESLKRMYPTKQVPAAFEKIKGIAKLTSDQVDDIVSNKAKSFLKETKAGIGKFFDNLDSQYSNWLDELISQRKMINNVDEVYDTVMGRFNEVLKRNVAEGKITSEQARVFYEEMSESLKCCSKVKSKLDEMLGDGLVAKKPKKTKTPIYGDDNYGVTPNELKAVNNDGTDMVPPKTNFEDSEFFDLRSVDDLSKLKKYYINRIEPYTRWFLEQFNFYSKKELDEAKLNLYLEDFQDAFKRGIDTFRLSQNIDKAYIRDIVEKFQKIPRGVDMTVPGIGKNKTVYDVLWNDFMSQAKVYYKDSPDELLEFYQFCEKVKTFKSAGDKTLPMEEILSMDTYARSEISKTFDEAIQSKIESFKNPMAALNNKIKGLMFDALKMIFYKIISGTFKSPADFSRAMVKEMEKNRKLAIKGKVVSSTVQQRKTAIKFFAMNYLVSQILVPAIVACFEMAIEGYIVSKSEGKINLIDRDVNPEDSFMYRLIVNYIGNDILTGVKTDTYIANILPGKNLNGWEWGSVFGVVPGHRDDLLISLIKFSGYMWFGGQGEQSSEEYAEKAANEALKGNVPKMPRDLDPMPESEKSELHNKFDKYCMLPDSNTYEELTVLEKGLLRKFAYSKNNNLWIEDPYDSSKRYYIIMNPKRSSTNLKVNTFLWYNNGDNKTITELGKKISSEFKDTSEIEELLNINPNQENEGGEGNEETLLKQSINKRNNMILENNSGKKFGDDNFKHWKDTFTFKAIDEKNPGQYKEVKINMEDVMDRINHYRKKYDEDDAFVRAVIDTHEDVIKVMFTKDLAHLQETHKPLGLALILQQISESRGEMEIWSVARPANGNWFLVKGDYTPKQMVTMDLQKNEPRNKETKVVTRAEDDLKKKEISAIQKLKNDEKSGLEELPIKVREKVKEKISRGWTTEVPFETFDVYYKKSEINSAFNEKIKIYKLIPSNEFFNSLIKNSSRIRTKRGFCKSISNITNEFKMTESQQKIADHILNTCNRMYGNQKLKKYKPVNQND